MGKLILAGFGTGIVSAWLWSLAAAQTAGTAPAPVPAVSVPAATRPTDPQALRRTPAVEIFQKWSDTVVCVAGPTVKDDRPPGDEFFALPNMKPLEGRIGTGFVIHEAGYIVANAHSAERIVAHRALLSDGKSYPAELIGSVHGQDLALLQVNAGRPLHAVQLARSGDVLIGETVIVVGNPHGLMRTCTVGVIGAVGRASTLADVRGVTLRDLIQSDAGINPGSSGGPWFNILGEVLGMTASMKKDSENIGFAISAATLRRTLPDLLDVEARQAVTTGIALPADGPCQVTAVQPGSPAATAGFAVGDVITRFAERSTPTVLDFHLAMIGRRPEETVVAGVTRQGTAGTISLTLGRRPKPDGAALLQQKLGLTAIPLDAEKAKSTAMRVARGVTVTAVDSNVFQTAQHKPEPGDVLARIDQIRPRDMDHVGLLLDKVRPGQFVSLVLLRVKGNLATRLDLRTRAR